jgi:hypothetical protein
LISRKGLLLPQRLFAGFSQTVNTLFMQKKKTYQTANFLLAAVIVLAAASCSKQKTLEKEAEKFNSQCPVYSPAGDVRIDSCMAEPGLVMHCYCTHLLLKGKGLTEKELVQFSESLKPLSLQRLANNVAFENLKKTGASILYTYYGADGIFLYDISISHSDLENYDPNAALTPAVSKQQLIDAARLEADMMKKQLPIHSAPGADIVEIEFLESEVQFVYTIKLSDNTESIAKEDPEAFSENCKTGVENELRSNEVTSSYFANGFSFKYIYTDSQGKELATIIID